MRGTRSEKSVVADECGSGVVNDLSQREIEVCSAARAVVVRAGTDRAEVNVAALGAAESVGIQVGAGTYLV